MTRADLDKQIGKYVKIILFDDTIMFGFLAKTGEERFKNNPNLCLKKGYYFLTANKTSLNCETCLFRVSHIKKILY